MLASIGCASRVEPGPDTPTNSVEASVAVNIDADSNANAEVEADKVPSQADVVSKISESIVGLEKAGPGFQQSGLLMNFSDLDAVPGRLLRLRSDTRGAVRTTGVTSDSTLDPVHGQDVALWADEANGLNFIGGSTKPNFRGDSVRLRSSSFATSASCSTLSIADRPSWTFALSGGIELGTACNLYSESVSDSEYQELRLDHEGYLEYAIKPSGGPEVVARSSSSIAGRYPASVAGSAPVPEYNQDAVSRTRYRLTLTPGHRFSRNDQVTVHGLGAPYDGTHTITEATDTEISYIVDSDYLVAGAAGFDAFYLQALGRATTPALAGGDITLVLACWVYIDTKRPVDQRIMASLDAAANKRQYQLIYKGIDDRFAFSVSADGTSATFDSVLANTLGPITESRWYFLCAYHDHANDVIGISVNNGPFDTASHASGIASNNAPFLLGAYGTLSVRDGCLDGRIDSACVMRSPTETFSNIASSLYNGGNGRRYSELNSAQKTEFGLSAWWDLDEATEAIRLDSHGSNHLTPYGNLGYLPKLKIGKVLNAPPASAVPTAGARSIRHNSSLGISGNTLDRRFLQDVNSTSWTISGWVKKTSTSRDGTASGIFASFGVTDFRDDPKTVTIGTNASATPGSYRLAIPGGLAANFGNATLDAWVHLAAVRNGNTITLYTNGVSVNTIDLTSNPTHASAFRGLGFGFDSGSANAASVAFDNWGIWTTIALSGPNVASLYNNGSGASFASLSPELKTGLTAWYNADEVGGRLIDASGNGNHLIERGSVPATQGVASGIAYSSATVDGYVVGNGRYYVDPVIRTDSDSTYDLSRIGPTIRRSGSTVSFFDRGVSLGTDTISGAGPAVGTAAVFAGSARHAAPRGAIDHVYINGSSLSNADIADLGAIFAVKANRTYGYGPLGVGFDATEFPGVDRRQMHAYQYLWNFVDRSTGNLHTLDVSKWSGQTYATPTGFFVTQVFDNPGTYDVYLSVVSPKHDRSGVDRTPSLLWAGKWGSITVDARPANGPKIYVDSTVADDSGSGTIASPKKTIAAAVALATQPHTQIFLKRDGSFPIPNTIDLTNAPRGLQFEPYGTGAKPVIAAVASSSNTDFFKIELTFDLRFVDLAPNGRAPGRTNDCKFIFASASMLTLVKGCDSSKVFLFFNQLGSARGVILDRNKIAPTNYGLYGLAYYEFGVTRNEFNDGNVNKDPSFEHMCRTMGSSKVHYSYNGRDTATWGDFLLQGREWLTPRLDSIYYVITDNYGEDLNVTAENGFKPEPLRMGGSRYQIERNRLVTPKFAESDSADAPRK